MRSVIRKSLSIVLAAVMVLTLASAAFAALPNYAPIDDETAMINGYDEEAVLEDGLLELIDYVEFGDISLKFIGISEGAFAYDALDESARTAFLETVKEITVAEGVKTVEAKAFAQLPNLEKITFKGDVEIGEEAFLDCAALTSVEFDGVANVCDSAFSGCSALSDIKLGKKGEYVGTGASLADTAFYKNYALDFVTIGTTLIDYKGNDAEVTVPENVTKIGLSAFEGNKTLKKINLNKYIDTLGDRAFYGCTKLAEVNFADAELANIGVDVFTNTAYFNKFEGDFFTIGTLLVKYLGDDADVFIPKTVTEIAANCFDGCYSAKNPDGYTWVVSAIYVPANLTEFGENCFALAQLDNGEYYVPRIYTYSDTASADALKELGYETTSMPRLGDLDNDGAITSADARQALRYAVKLDPMKNAGVKNAADVDFDKSVTPADARIILRIAVKLDCAPEELFNAPVSDFEILMAYTQAMKNIASSGAGYTKTVSDTVVSSKMNATAKINLYKTLANKGAVNETVTYTHDTEEAAANVDFCSLLSTDEIKSAVCEVKDGKYNITITFNDITDNSGRCDLFKVFPIMKLSDFTSDFAGKNWWTPLYDSDYHANGISKCDLTYKNPTVKLVCDKDTYEVTDCTLSCTYDFAIDGFINLLPIANTALTRTLTINYSDFLYKTLDGEI